MAGAVGGRGHGHGGGPGSNRQGLAGGGRFGLAIGDRPHGCTVAGFVAAAPALDALVEHSTQIPLGTSSILLYLAVTIGVQREIVRWRAARLTQ